MPLDGAHLLCKLGWCVGFVGITSALGGIRHWGQSFGMSDTEDNPSGMSDIEDNPFGMSDIGDNPFGMSDFANYSTGQGYSQFDSSALPRFFTPTSEVDVAQSWTSDAQNFSAPFADHAVDANIFLPFRQTPQISRDTIPQSYYLPYVYQSQDAPRSNFGVPASASIAESDFTEQSTHFVDILKLVHRNTSKL